MNDKEMLELAAQSVGIVIVGWTETDTPLAYFDCRREWNPLRHQEQATRVRHLLHLTITLDKEYAYASGPGLPWGLGSVSESIAGCGGRRAAWRRVIVRAAAIIGQEAVRARAVEPQSVMANGLTEAETLATASVAGLLRPTTQLAVERVYLVPTGVVVRGQETYTRHDDRPPALCDSECLFTRPLGAGGMDSRTATDLAIAAASPPRLDSSLRVLELKMRVMGTRLRKYGADTQLGKCGRELIGAADVVATWADDVVVESLNRT